MDKIEEVLTRGVANILPEKSGLAKLMAGKKIRVYLGIDPTGPKLHLGHTIPLRKLQQFADLGHEVILLFGTGTVLAGDPSQREKARGKITQDEIENNIKTWKNQAEKIMDFEKVQVKQNGDWLLKLTTAEILNIASNISAVQLFKRDMFQKRIEAGDTIWTHELLYPLLQGYDSVHLDIDLEIGGTDQTFNMLIGRELQKKMNGREKYVLATPLISGTDGKQMSKSSGNCIWLDDPPKDMYGKIMSMADSQIEEYWVNLTDMPKEKLKSLKPFDAKKQLAHEIVKIYHSQNSATSAQTEFESTFQKGKLPEEINTKVQENTSVIDAVTTLVSSKTQAKRLLEQNAIEVNGHVATDPKLKLEKGQVLKVGKKIFAKVE